MLGWALVRVAVGYTGLGMEAGLRTIDERMMRQALSLAHVAARLGEVPVGAVVYRGEKVFGAGINLREHAADPTAHAELIAMRQAGRRLGTWRLDECSLAVTLEPCPMCAGAMVNARLGRLIYGCRDPKMGCVDSLFRLCHEERFNHRIFCLEGVDREACGAVLSDFFAQRRAGANPPKPVFDPSLDLLDWQHWLKIRDPGTATHVRQDAGEPAG